MFPGPGLKSPTSGRWVAVVEGVCVALFGNTAPTTPPTVDMADDILPGLLSILMASDLSCAGVNDLKFL